MMPAQLARGVNRAANQVHGRSSSNYRNLILPTSAAGAYFLTNTIGTRPHLLELPFRYPFMENLVISLENIEANHHSEYTQIIPLRAVIEIESTDGAAATAEH
jgi:hypothetical protein